MTSVSTCLACTLMCYERSILFLCDGSLPSWKLTPPYLSPLPGEEGTESMFVKLKKSVKKKMLQLFLEALWVVSKLESRYRSSLFSLELPPPHPFFYKVRFSHLHIFTLFSCLSPLLLLPTFFLSVLFKDGQCAMWRTQTSCFFVCISLHPPHPPFRKRGGWKFKLYEYGPNSFKLYSQWKIFIEAA